MIRAWGLVAALSVGVAACQPDTCGDIECIMNHLELTLDGHAAPLTALPAGMVPSAMGPTTTVSLASFGLLVTPISSPNWGDPVLMMEAGLPAHAGIGSADEAQTPTITNQPADISLATTDSEVGIALSIADPNREIPTLAFTPFDLADGRPYPHCVWLTRTDRDGRDVQQVILRARITAFIQRIDFSSGGSSCTNPNLKLPNGLPANLAINACPMGQKPCGSGCIPETGTVCCYQAGKGGDSTSYCPNGSGGATEGNCPAGAPGGSMWSCSTDGNLMSLDCPSGQHHCGELCYFDDHPCCPIGTKDPQCLAGAPLFAGPPVAVHVKGPVDTGPSLGGGGGGGSGGSGGGSGGGGGPCSGGGQYGSARFCIQDGTSSTCSCNVDASQTNMCITPAFWQQYFGSSFPPMCARQGTSCVASDGRTMTTYCCPGLSCIGAGGPACGSGQGTCQPHS